MSLRKSRRGSNSFWIPLKATFKASGLTVDAETANLKVAIWLREVANVRMHSGLKERPEDRWLIERDHLTPYAGTVVDWAPRLSHPLPPPHESLQHPLSDYDALVVER